MQLKFVNVFENHKGQDVQHLVPAGDAEFSKIWRSLTGKRIATEKQVNALRDLVLEVRTSDAGVSIMQ